MERLFKITMFLLQWLLSFSLFFVINYILNGVLFDVINQDIHLDVILTLAKFYPTSNPCFSDNGTAFEDGDVSFSVVVVVLVFLCNHLCFI